MRSPYEFDEFSWFRHEKVDMIVTVKRHANSVRWLTFTTEMREKLDAKFWKMTLLATGSTKIGRPMYFPSTEELIRKRMITEGYMDERT